MSNGIVWGKRGGPETVVTYQGVTRTLSQWAAHLGITERPMFERLRKLPLDEAMTKPIRYRPDTPPNLGKKYKKKSHISMNNFIGFGVPLR